MTVGLHLERRGRVSVLGPAIAATLLGGVELERKSRWQNWGEPLSGLRAGPSTFWGPGPDADSGPDTAEAICRRVVVSDVAHKLGETWTLSPALRRHSPALASAAALQPRHDIGDGPGH